MDNHGWVEDAKGIEDPLDLSERGDDFRAKISLEERPADATIAVLARDDTAAVAGEVGDFNGDLSHVLEVGVIVEIEHGAYVQNADRGVSPVSGLSAVTGDNFFEFADEPRELLDRDGIVFDEGLRLALSRETMQKCFAALAKGPGVGH